MRSDRRPELQELTHLPGVVRTLRRDGEWRDLGRAGDDPTLRHENGSQNFVRPDADLPSLLVVRDLVGWRGATFMMSRWNRGAIKAPAEFVDIPE
ncbi:MAG: hypothetical protein M3P48_05435 [Actinomycetota bacterium]|nr:hypothetical protein [Actinomycetota bacterium]